NTDDNDGSNDNVILSGELNVAGISANGQILASPAGAQVDGTFVMLSAGSGIGVPTSGGSINTYVAALDASTITGGIYVQTPAPAVCGAYVILTPGSQGGGDTLTLVPSPGPTWLNYGYQPGDTIAILGARNAANSGPFTIASISPDGYTATLSVSGVLAPE